MTERKWIYITFPTDDVFRLDAEVVARSRAEYYAEVDSETSVEEEVEFALSDEMVLKDWLHGNMDWEDIEDAVEKVKTDDPDFAGMWMEADISFED